MTAAIRKRLKEGDPKEWHSKVGAGVEIGGGGIIWSLEEVWYGMVWPGMVVMD